MIAILILAAGQSRRMRGSDKLTQIVAGDPLLRLQAKRALATGYPVYVALPDAAHPRLTCLEDLAVIPIIVPEAYQGMGVTLREAVAALPPCDAFLVMLADLVALDTPDLQTIIAARDTHPDFDVWRGATKDGRPGHPILFDQTLRPAFASLNGDEGGAALLRNADLRICTIRLPENHALLDMDTPEDWAAWQATQTAPSK